MKRTFNHLRSINYERVKYGNVLLKLSTSKVLWTNPLLSLFMQYLQAMIVTAANRISNIANYQNPMHNETFNK